MPGVPGRSGGQNRLTAAEHVSRGTFRRSRHAAPAASPAPAISAADRRRALCGLSPAARRMATRLLECYGDWDVAGLTTLRSYVLSVERLTPLEAAGVASPALSRAVRASLALLNALHLEGTR